MPIKIFYIKKKIHSVNTFFVCEIKAGGEVDVGNREWARGFAPWWRCTACEQGTWRTSIALCFRVS